MSANELGSLLASLDLSKNELSMVELETLLS